MGKKDLRYYSGPLEVWGPPELSTTQHSIRTEYLISLIKKKIKSNLYINYSN